MKKVLILTYYWPPSGGAGVQRWLKFVKYLPQLGYEPIVYTHSNGEVPSIDESLEKEIPEGIKVLKTEIWEPYGFYKSLTGKKGEKINSGFLSEQKTKKSALQNLSIWIRGNFFIPDARKFWIKPSVKYLSEFIENNSIDFIISTGPPHTMHLIALGLKKKFNIKWVADFRDPWTNIDFYKDLKLTSFADKKHRRLEREVLQKADLCISVGKTWSEELEVLGAEKCVTITNGYDDEDNVNVEVQLDKKISIAHIGSFTKSRNPELLLEVLKDLKSKYPNLDELLEIKLVGKVDYTITELFKSYDLENLIRKVEYLPHNLFLEEQRKSHVLLLVVNETPNAKGITTGKVFEYLAAKRPILAIAPEGGDLEVLINETDSGLVVNSSNKEELKQFLIQLLDNNPKEYSYKNIEKFSRFNLTKKLVEELENLSTQ